MYSTSGISMTLRGGDGSAAPGAVFMREQSVPESGEAFGGWTATERNACRSRSRLERWWPEPLFAW